MKSDSNYLIKSKSTKYLFKKVEDLFKKNRRKYLNYVLRKVLDKTISEDIIQDVFVNILYRLAKTNKEIKNLSAYIFKSLQFRIIDYYRQKDSSKIINNIDISDFLGEDEDKFNILFDSYSNIVDNSYNPYLILKEKETYFVIIKYLEKLNDTEKYVFIRSKIVGESFKEISEYTGVNINTLLSRSHSAILKIRGYFLKYSPDLIPEHYLN